MVTTDTNNDDLLILSDDDSDTDTDTLIMDDNTLNDDLISSNEELITFDDLDASESVQMEDNINNTDSLSSFDDDLSSDSLDFWDIKEEILNEDNLTETESIIDEPIFDTPSLITENLSVWTMEDILNRAMAELDSRSEVIIKERDIEEANIMDLNEQIKALEAKVTIANDKVLALNEEQSMISKNTKAIERMKDSNVTPKTTQKNK